jgi:hypothetical protein
MPQGIIKEFTSEFPLPVEILPLRTIGLAVATFCMITFFMNHPHGWGSRGQLRASAFPVLRHSDLLNRFNRPLECIL